MLVPNIDFQELLFSSSACKSKSYLKGFDVFLYLPQTDPYQCFIQAFTNKSKLKLQFLKSSTSKLLWNQRQKAGIKRAWCAHVQVSRLENKNHCKSHFESIHNQRAIHLLSRCLNKSVSNKGNETRCFFLFCKTNQKMACRFISKFQSFNSSFLEDEEGSC